MKVLGVIMGALFVVFLGTAAAAPPADISMTEEWYLIQSQPDVDKQEGNVYVTEGMLFEDPIESTKEWYLLDQEVTAGEVSKKFSKAPEMNEALYNRCLQNAEQEPNAEAWCALKFMR